MTEELKFLQILDKANRERTKSVVKYFTVGQLTPILLKGWSIARFYPDQLPRPYSDVDLAFDPNDREAVLELWERMSVSGAVVDLHFGLKGLDRLPIWSIAELTYEAELDGLPIRVLGDEDNLRITSVHWLTDGGVSRERLWDVYYLALNRNSDFDWERCLESNGQIRKTWVVTAIATARDYLALDVSGFPSEIQEFVLPKWYRETLEKEWERGPYIRRVMSTVTTRPKLLFEQLHRRFPPNRIAATIDTETPIDDSSRIPAQVKSLTKKIRPFARGIGIRLKYSLRREQPE